VAEAAARFALLCQWRPPFFFFWFAHALLIVTSEQEAHTWVDFAQCKDAEGQMDVTKKWGLGYELQWVAVKR
jgi:hypothetical protein